MDLDLRTIEPDELDAFAASVAVPFLEAGNEAAMAYERGVVEPERAWVVVDRGRFVANACIYTRNVTVPGASGQPCPTVPMAAISAVGVHPTHRRRGLLRRLMDAMLDDARARHEPLAGLLASEAGIYGRFGFGLAATSASVAIDTAGATLRAPVPALDLELLDAYEAAKVLPRLHDRLRRTRGGEVNRTPASWEAELADPVSNRGGGSARYYAIGDDGYAVYRAHEWSAAGRNGARLEVGDLYGDTPEAEAALWQFLCHVDLVQEVSARRRPVDEALRWRLVDPRQLRTRSLQDQLWVCVLDVAAALEARRYRVEGTLTLDIHPDGAAPPDPAVTGRWTLEAGPDGATCRRRAKGADTDVTLSAADLGAAYLGGVAPSTLAAAGRMAEERAGALAMADALFATFPAPFTGTRF